MIKPISISLACVVLGGVIQPANASDYERGNFSVGADYTGARHESSDAFGPLGMEPVRMNDQRWSFPIDVGVNSRF